MPLETALVIGQLLVGLAGLGLSVWTLADSARTARVLSEARTNGARWILMTGDLIEEAIRVALHVCIVFPTAVMLLEGRVYFHRWRSWVFIVMTVLLTVSSVAALWTRRAVMQSLARAQGSTTGAR